MPKSFVLVAAILGALVVPGAAAIAGATPSYPANAAGDWSGTIRSGGAAKHIFVHIRRTLAGAYVGTMDSPEGVERNVEIKPLAATDGAFAFAAGQARFQGEWDAARGRWTGTWTDAGESWPVDLQQDVDSATSRRLIQRPE